jgi:hypothetical protein
MASGASAPLSPPGSPSSNTLPENHARELAEAIVDFGH